MKGWLHRLFKAIDNMDADCFVAFLTPDASFRFSNADAVEGRETIRNTISGFFSSLKGLHHNVLGVWEDKEAVICEGEATYTTHDSRELTFPFVNVFRMKGELIADYRVFIDTSPLYSSSG